MPLSVADRLDILDLAARYNHAIDGGDPEAWANTFTEDGQLETGSTAVRGREELLEFVRSRDPAKPIRHWNSSVLVEGDGDDASAKVYLITLDVAGPPKMRSSGVYHDTLKRVNGEWKFTHRSFRSDLRTPRQ